MWYEILIKNEFAEYFIDSDPALEADVCMVKRMLQGYADIVNGVLFAWLVLGDDKFELTEKQLGEVVFRSYKHCRASLHLTAFKSFAELYRSVYMQFKKAPYNANEELLDAEQCAALLVYPFAREQGSLEAFWKSGELKKYLLALKSKCMA